MHRGSASGAEAQLQQFLTAHLDAPQRDDVGALLGQAMLFLDSPNAGAPESSAWREAVSAALSGGAGPAGRRGGAAPGTRRPVRPH